MKTEAGDGPFKNWPLVVLLVVGLAYLSILIILNCLIRTKINEDRGRGWPTKNGH